METARRPGTEMTSERLPAIIRPSALTPIDGAHLVPALIADAGDPAAWRYIEFFTANIRNPNTRRDYLSCRAIRSCIQWRIATPGRRTSTCK